MGAWNPQESGRKAPLSCTAAFSSAAVQFFACCSAASGPNDFRTAEKPMLQCSSAAQQSENCSATSVFACAMLQGWVRESETTIKIKFALFRGGWAGGQGGKLPKTLFFMGNATTIKFWKCKFYCRDILLSLRRLLVGFRGVGFSLDRLGLAEESQVSFRCGDSSQCHLRLKTKELAIANAVMHAVSRHCKQMFPGPQHRNERTKKKKRQTPKTGTRYKTRNDG